MRRALLCLVLAIAACQQRSDRGGSVAIDSLVVYEAASLAVPMRAALDSFSRRGGATVAQEEHGASLELARRLTELHRIPDVIALADQEVFPQMLMPGMVRWYATFARNRMVIAFTGRSRHATEVTAANWWAVLLRDDVLVGRTDPELAPAGYRALIVYRLAEAYYHEPGLATRLEARTPPRLMRGNAAELAALLAAGELDYIVEYESLARAQHFRYITLPESIDLGEASRADTYASASVRVARGHDTVELHGVPIRYGVAIPRASPHPATAERFVRFLLGANGRAILRAHNVDVLDRAVFVGDSVPPSLRRSAAP